MTLLAELKVYLSIESDQFDVLFNQILDDTQIQLGSLVGEVINPLPNQLQYVVIQVAIKRFRRIGSEGMSKESIEGNTKEFYVDDFSEFGYIINSYANLIPSDDSESGRVVLY